MTTDSYSKEFQAMLDVLDKAYDQRHPDAAERAEQARNLRLAEAAKLNRRIALRAGWMGENPHGTRIVDSDDYFLGFKLVAVSVDGLTGERDRLLAEVEGIDELIRRWGNKRLLPRFYAVDKDGLELAGPTPEAALKQPRQRREPVVRRLLMRNHIQSRHYEAALEIEECLHAATVAVCARIRAMDGAGGRPGSRVWREPSMPDWLADVHRWHYKPWVEALHQADEVANQSRATPRPPRLPFVLAVVVHDHSLDVARREHGLGYEIALRWLRQSLGWYADLMDMVPIERPGERV